MEMYLTREPRAPARVRSERTKIKKLDYDNSTNGTRVNNVPIKEKVLYFGDVLQIGNAEVIYSCEDIDPTPKKIPMVNISMSESDTNIISDMKNLTPFPGKKRRWHKLLIIIVLTTLFVTIITLLGVLVMMMFTV